MPDFFLPHILERSTQKETMDLPDANVKKLLNTIRQFRLINILFSSSRELIKNKFFSIMDRDKRREYTLLELGAGGCDIALWAVKEARKRGIRLSVTAVDNDTRIFPMVQKSLENVPEIRLLNRSVFELDSLGTFDFIFSNHFLHHLDWNEIKGLLKQTMRMTKLAFLFNDLKRSRWAYWAYTIFSGLFLHDSLAFEDGRLSILRGFQPEELSKLLANSFPDEPIEIVEYPPWRVTIQTGSSL